MLQRSLEPPWLKKQHSLAISPKNMTYKIYSFRFSMFSQLKGPGTSSAHGRKKLFAVSSPSDTLHSVVERQKRRNHFENLQTNQTIAMLLENFYENVSNECEFQIYSQFEQNLSMSTSTSVYVLRQVWSSKAKQGILYHCDIECLGLRQHKKFLFLVPARIIFEQCITKCFILYFTKTAT